MEFSIAHPFETLNQIGQSFYPDGKVPWDDPMAPNLENRGENRRTTGRLRACSYCGSMHPTDLVKAIQAGANGEWADFKYGWPHKSYWIGIPNPHVGLMESRISSNFRQEGFIQIDENHWEEPGKPAPSTTDGKFYTVHLMDATPDEKEIIEKALHLSFTFTGDGKVAWRRV